MVVLGSVMIALYPICVLVFSAKHITELHSFDLKRGVWRLYNTNLVYWELYISQDGSWNNIKKRAPGKYRNI